MEQTIIRCAGSYEALTRHIARSGIHTLLVVRDSAWPHLAVSRAIDGLTCCRVVPFDRFAPNPTYDSVKDAVGVFRREGCDGILAVGGGSAIDVAKCVKLFCGTDPALHTLSQTNEPNAVPLIAMPTTAGTGSEATRFAVIYDRGEKQSVNDVSCIPGTVVMDPTVLRSLPLYQKKATMLDALCHAIESLWSVRSTEESRALSLSAIRQVLRWKDGYLSGDDEALEGMLWAAHTAGQAIDLTQTTAGHAMCYKLTSLYGYAHGHAAALCVRVLWPWMLSHPERLTDPRGEAHARQVFAQLAEAFGRDTPEEAAASFAALLDALALERPAVTEEQLALLSVSVNPVRLKNHPYRLEGETEGLYRTIARCIL